MKSNRRLDADEMARLTFLISADVKRELDQLCAQEDLTTSQVLRRLIAAYLQRDGRADAAAGAATQL